MKGIYEPWGFLFLFSTGVHEVSVGGDDGWMVMAVVKASFPCSFSS